MTVARQLENYENQYLSKFAQKSAETKGRLNKEEKCELRTEFQRDRDRIIHSKAFRRLKHKTQVFVLTSSDHTRTRLTHTLEVSQIARTIARALFLNEDLTEAIALGHDLGHTPFGHAGERALSELSKKGFKHNEQSLRVVSVLERPGGLNLTAEVLDGILCHTGDKEPETLEGKIIRIADRIAYINHDIDDAVRSGELKEEELPKEYTDVLGKTHSERISTMIKSIVNESMNKPDIIMEKSVLEAMMGLRDFMFENVYKSPYALKEEEKAFEILKTLYRKYTEKPELMGYEKIEFDDTDVKIVDYIAGMTDDFAIKAFEMLK